MKKKVIIIFNVIDTLIIMAFTIMYGSAVITATLQMPVSLVAGAMILLLWIFVVALWIIGRKIIRQ